ASASRIATRLELWRALAVPHGACHRPIRQLPHIGRAPQHQSTSAHVAAADELFGEQQSLIENRGERVDILAGRDASEQNDTRRGRKIRRETLDIAGEWSDEALTSSREVDVGKGEQVVPSDQRVERDQSALGRNDKGRRPVVRTTAEGTCVRELAPKVQTAQEAEDLADRSALGANPRRQLEGGVRAQKDFRPPTIAARGGEKEDRVHRLFAT